MRVYLKARTATTVLRTLIESALRKLWAYPVITSVFWLIPAIVDTNHAIWLSEASEPPKLLGDAAFGLPFLSGVFSAAFFFHANPSVRGALIAFVTCSGNNEGIRESIDASKAIKKFNSRPKVMSDTPTVVVNPIGGVDQIKVVEGEGCNKSTERPSEIELGARISEV